MPQTLELSRAESGVLVRRLRLWGWGALLLLLGIAFLLIGVLSGVTGQHLPQMSVLFTVIWALAFGIIFLSLGLAMTRHGEIFLFSPQGLFVEFYRMRAMHWKVDYPLAWLQEIVVVKQPGPYPLYRVLVSIQDRPEVELAEDLNSEEAWQLASSVAGPAFLRVRERS